MDETTIQTLQEEARRVLRERHQITDESTPEGGLMVRGKLGKGLKIGDEVHKDFVMREHTTEDLFAAERAAPQQNQIAFKAALIARQLVSIGTYEGPFTLALIGKGIAPKDLEVLMFAREELERLGE